MRITWPKTSAPAEEQVARAMSLLELYGAPRDTDLWHSIDCVVMRKNMVIARLETQITVLREGLR